jgi:hypothetical protein
VRRDSGGFPSSARLRCGTPRAFPSAMPISPSPRTGPIDPRDRAIRHGLIALWTVAILSTLGVLALTFSRDRGSVVATVSPSLVAGTPGGVAIENTTPSPDATPSATPLLSPTPRPTPEPTAAATPIPQTVAPSVTPAAAAATPAPSLAPTPIAEATSDPSDTVAAFYASVSSGQFDAAYSLWSEHMRATYPRQENLDERFAETASIVFQDLHVAEQSADRATVQANFTETYDSGSSRIFVGYWRLVLVEGIWLLDEPNY